MITVDVSKENPVTNSLGMKFVAVRKTNVLSGIHETRHKAGL